MKRAAVIFLPILVVVAGCIDFSRPYKEVYYYQVNYKTQKFDGTPQRNVILRMGVFNVAPSFQSLKILYAATENKRKSYDYHQWVVAPNDMIASLFERDMAKSGLYAAVVDARSSLPPQYELEGTVEEIYELDEGDAFNAVLAIRFTLFAYPEKVGRKEVLFQKSYRKTVAAPSRTPEGVVQAMSDAAANISLRIQKRVNKAVVEHEKRKAERVEK